jgi:hypothetical protein
MQEKTCCFCRETKIVSEFFKDSSRRDGLSSRCKLCTSQKNKRYVDANKEKVAERQRQHYEANRDVLLEKMREYSSSNREVLKARHAQYYQARKEYFRDLNAKWREAQGSEALAEKSRAYYERHPDRAKLAARLYARRVRKATPPWVDVAALRSVYERALRATRETGVQYHVDHIVPLKGANVSGLHVPWNLQVLTATENLIKGNRFSG